MKLRMLAAAVFFMAALIIGGLFLFNKSKILPPNEIIQTTIEAQQKLNEERPEDRVYAHLDKPFYAPGESIWFTTYVRNAIDLTPSSKSEIVRAELINPKGEVEMEYKIPLNDAGVGKGDFKLPKNLPGGQYVFQAYTLWQTNDKDPAIFRKEIQVQKVILPRLKMDLDFVRDAFAPGDKVNAELKLTTNGNKALGNHPFKYTLKVKGKKEFALKGKTDADGTAPVAFTLPRKINTDDVLVNLTLDYQGSRESIARTVPVLMSEIEMQFFPEGGDLVSGLQSKVAFRATDLVGNSVDVQGVILNSKGEHVADFNSLHDGMGAFVVTPDNSQYTAKVTFPSHVQKTFELPRAERDGYTLSIDDITADDVNLIIRSTSASEVSLIASIRGKTHFSTGLKIEKGKNKVKIPLDKLPMGVAQITLFDQSGIARAERLAFVNMDEGMSINIKTNKDQYLPREKVEMEISVTDADNQPIQTDLSVAVVDDQLLSFADDKSSNLLSWMMMEADLDIEVDEPSFYFDESEADADLAMDYLLMTTGWRRFDWKTLAANDFPKLESRGERMVLAGTVLDDQGNPINKAKIKIIGENTITNTESDGYFEMDGVDLIKEPVSISISAPGHFRQEQVVGDYGIFDYQLFNRELGKGIKVNERSNRLAQANQLGLTDEIVQRQAPKKVVSSIFTQSQLQVVNFSKRYDDVNMSSAENYKPEEFDEGVDYNLVDHRIRTTVNNDEDDEELEGAYMTDVAFYRVREFPVKKYKSTKIDKRKDFRSTAYWNGHVETDEKGKASLAFWNTDAVTSFKATVEGMGKNGSIGRAEKEYVTQMPFSISAKIPVEVTQGDVFIVPVTLTNNTKGKVSGKLDIKHPSNLVPLNNPGGNVTLRPGKSKVVKIKYEVKHSSVEGDMDQLTIGFKNGLFQDKIEEDITVVPRGFPVRIAYSGTGKETRYDVQIKDLEDKSLDVELQAYPSALTEIVQGMDGMMKKPYGCFEQTSSCNYPNLLALQYLRQTEQSNPRLERKTHELLEFGYKRLSGFESPNGGFDWFGSDQAHEGITAFAIMQFSHMKSVYKGVDQRIIDRSVKWLRTRMDGKGSFIRDERTTWSLGLNKDNKVFDAFIVYCLSEAGIKGFERELNAVYDAAAESDDPYMVGMAALAHHNYGKKKKANELTSRQDQLLGTGSAIVSSDARTIFGGKSGNFELEAKALLVLNLSKTNQPNVTRVKELAKEIRESRKWDSSFGPTHTTVLGMRALMAYNEVAKQTEEDGTIAFYVEGKRVAEKQYFKGSHDVIKIDGLEKFFGEGKYDFNVVFEGVKHPLPHTVSFKWNTIQPVSSKDKPIAMSTRIRQKDIKVGDQVRMDVKLENITGNVQPTPMAIVGLPAGLSPQVRQLNELVEKEKIGYYEITGSNVILYFRHIKRGEEKNIPLDLKADFAGNFQASASSAYTYYNDEDKHWIPGAKVEITN